MVKRAAYQKHFVVCHIIYKNIPSYLKVHLALNHFSVESTTLLWIASNLALVVGFCFVC